MTAHTPFGLGTFAAAGRDDAFAGLVVGDVVVPLEPTTTVRGLLEDWDAALPALQARADADIGGAASLALADVRPLPPIDPVGQIFQAGANYLTHVLDMMDGAAARGDLSDGSTPQERDQARAALQERARTGRPFVFQGSAHAMTGARDEVILPAGFEQYDWELELVAVIGRRARRISREDALDVVAGYTIANDLSLRDALRRPDVPGGIDWLAAKNPPTFLPVGPWITPAAQVGDPMDLRIRLDVNGRVMQDETTADMMFDVAALIAYVSTVAELRPGDLLLTGSPAGNGASHGVFLRPGDVMDGSITGLGTHRNVCVAEVPAGVPA
jgi:2-keto-4-pentenoate hydratase/2-oxohepta-3-ene-1,7-dioic acid hydratase in catechol pathway